MISVFFLTEQYYILLELPKTLIYLFAITVYA